MTELQTFQIESISKLLNTLGIFFEIKQTREDAISIHAAIPFQRWEIDICEDGATELEVFRSDGVTLVEDIAATIAHLLES